MKRITAIKMAIIYIVISSCTWLGFWLKQFVFDTNASGVDQTTVSSHVVYYAFGVLVTLLLSKFLPRAIIWLFLENDRLRRAILGDLNVEGYWFVEWLDIEANGDKILKGESCRGYELTRFKFTRNFDYLAEQSINFAQESDEAIDQDTPVGKCCNGRCQLTNSIYQIHISDEKKYISSFEYNDGKIRKRGVSKVEFLTPPGEKKPLHYEGIIMGFEDNYREKHVGRPIDGKVIDAWKKLHPDKCEWQRQLLKHRGEIPSSSHVATQVQTGTSTSGSSPQA